MTPDGTDDSLTGTGLSAPTLATGCVHGVVVTLTWASVQSHGIDTVPHLYAWVVSGAVLVGAAAGYLSGREGLVTPVAVLVVGLLASASATGEYYRSLGNAAAAAFPTPIWVYAVFWPLALVAAASAGLVERAVRGRLVPHLTSGSGRSP